MLFKEISLDWITELPTSMWNGQEYNSIFTIIYYIIKYILFLPTCEDTITVNLI